MERGSARDRDKLIISVDDCIELCGVSTADCAELYASIDRNRARLREWLPWIDAAYNQGTLFAFLQQKEGENLSHAGLTTNVRFNGQLCGSIGLHSINYTHRNTSIGYWIDSAYEGRGIMTRACRAIVTEGFREYGLHRIEIRCGVGNRRSAAIPQRLGFIEEGIVREAEWLYDHWVDLRVFSKLDRDWCAVL